MNNTYNEYSTDGSLMHYGVKGMKWGIRRYQPYGQGYAGSTGRFIGDKSNRINKQGSASSKRKSKKKFKLTSNQKKMIAVGALAAVGVLALYGAHRINKKHIDLGKKNLEILRKNGETIKQVTNTLNSNREKLDKNIKISEKTLKALEKSGPVAVNKKTGKVITSNPDEIEKMIEAAEKAGKLKPLREVRAASAKQVPKYTTYDEFLEAREKFQKAAKSAKPIKISELEKEVDNALSRTQKMGDKLSEMKKRGAALEKGIDDDLNRMQRAADRLKEEANRASRIAGRTNNITDDANAKLIAKTAEQMRKYNKRRF